MRIQWNGGIKGFLRLLVDEPHDFRHAQELMDFLTESCLTDDPIPLRSEDYEIVATAALFMAIRDVAPWKRGNVLDSAARTLGGTSRLMNSGYDWFLSPLDLYAFGPAINRAARKLRPWQTDSQYALKCLAYDLLGESLAQTAGSHDHRP